MISDPMREHLEKKVQQLTAELMTLREETEIWKRLATIATQAAEQNAKKAQETRKLHSVQ